MPPRRRVTDKKNAKLFVLDTNVLLHDPTCLFRFEENDIFLPIFVLEELDNKKKGTTEVARNARQASRFLDEILRDSTEDIADGISLQSDYHKASTGRLYLQTSFLKYDLPQQLEFGKADNGILGVAQSMANQKQGRQHVILVSKDINMRIKAHAMGLDTQDYYNDKVLEDSDLLYTGSMALPNDFWNHVDEDVHAGKENGHDFYQVSGTICEDMYLNQFVHLDDASSPLDAIVTEHKGQTATLTRVTDYTHTKNSIWGITARNREQNFVLNLLMNPDIDFITLLGQAGTGKTLLTLAAALNQTMELKLYTEIIVTRVTVPVGEDIGFLPGTEEEKMAPWMGAIEDNLEVLNNTNSEGGAWGKSATRDLLGSRIKIKSLNFMRGRTFLNKFVIVDEAQNLTPKQMKTLITRAGPGTKMVCMGNIAQIDTPYISEGSSGLTYVVDRFKDWKHGGHITLTRGERSRLAAYASDVL